MLEQREYTIAEIGSQLGTATRQGIKRKLERYEVSFRITGRGENTIFTINEIKNEFKLFCIIELNFSAETDFYKLQYFLYYFFNDDDFRAMPDERKAVWIDGNNHHVSRPTIASYTQKLERENMILRDSGNYTYYFALKEHQRFVDKEEYSQAWREYWANREAGADSHEAIATMIADYGGVARKQAIPEINGIYNKKIEDMLSLIQKNIEKEHDEKIESTI